MICQADQFDPPAKDSISRWFLLPPDGEQFLEPVIKLLWLATV
jgi:hypothetical protein